MPTTRPMTCGKLATAMSLPSSQGLLAVVAGCALACAGSDAPSGAKHVEVPIEGATCERECLRPADVCSVGPDEPGCDDFSPDDCWSRCPGAVVSQDPPRPNPHLTWSSLALLGAALLTLGLVVIALK